MSETAKKRADDERPRQRSAQKASTSRESSSRPAKSSTSQTSSKRETTSKENRGPAPRQKPARRSGSTAVKVARDAMTQLMELTNREAEGVVGVERTEDGWQATIEVLEASRIPSTTDMLAEYEVDLNGDGELVGYRRTSRYLRGKARDE